jgi:hypothetical protein
MVKLVKFNILVTDSKGSDFLEANQGTCSAVRCLDKIYNGSVIGNVIAPYMRERYPDTIVHYYNSADFSIGGDLSEVIETHFQQHERERGKDLMMLFGYSDEGGMNNACGLDMRDYPNLRIPNWDPAIMALYDNKAFAAQIEKLAGKENMPVTETYKFDPYHTNMDSIGSIVASSFENISHVVIKPVDGKQGQGIIVIPTAKLSETLQYLLEDIKITGNKKMFDDGGFAEDYWLKLKPLVDNNHNRLPIFFQVQEFIPNEFKHAGHIWQATERFLWSHVVEENEDGTRNSVVTPHGGFKKLPRDPMKPGAGLNQRNTISYSKPHGYWEKFKHSTGQMNHKILIPADQLAAAAQPIKEKLEKMFHVLETMPEWQKKDLLRKTGSAETIGLTQEAINHALETIRARDPWAFEM